MDRVLPASMTAPLLDLWDTEGDKFMMNYWLMGNPFSMATAVLIVFLAIYVIAPRYSESLRHRDLRPIMLIANGTVFGMIGMGLMLGLALTGFGAECFRCDGTRPHDSDLRTSALKMIAFMYVMMKLLEFQRPLFATLRGSSASDHYKSIGYNLYLFGQLLMSYIGGVFYPAGPLVFWPMFDAVVMILGHGYLVLRLASPELHPNRLWIKLVSALSFLSCFSIMVHSYVFSIACAATSSKMSYLLNVAFYYNCAVVTGQIGYFLLLSKEDNHSKKRDQKTITMPDGMDCNRNNSDIIQGH